MNLSKLAIILGHAFAGWALCAASMGIGLANTSLENALIIHAIAAPILFMIVSIVYFRNFGYTTPLRTASIFVLFVLFVDFLIVALLINKSLEMFTSLLGTWITFALIFGSTYFTGLYLGKKPRPKRGD